MAETLKDEKMIILFGSQAPADLKDFCHIINVQPVEGDIEPGMGLYVNKERYEITAVGNTVEKSLNELGHITIRFNGAKDAELPGTLYIEDKPLPNFEIGTELKIAD